MRFVEMLKNAETICKYSFALAMNLKHVAFVFNADDLHLVGVDIMDSILWSVMELTTAFLVACMPAMRLVFRAKMPAYTEAITTSVSSLARRKSGASFSYLDHTPADADEHLCDAAGFGRTAPPPPPKTRDESPTGATGHGHDDGIPPV